jgi:Holliday junction resolvase-like predicted endonuclease
MKNAKTYINNTQETGEYGEKVVLYHLKTRGYRLIKANLRLKIGEIDLLMAKNKVIYIIEVKSARIRAQNDFNSQESVFKVEPEDSFNCKKLRKLKLLAAELMTYEWLSTCDIQIIGFVVRIFVNREGVVLKSLVQRLF